MSTLQPLWYAHEEGGVGHARSHGPAPRTACGLPAVPPRHCYPARALNSCPVCVEVIAAARRDARGQRGKEAATA